MLRPSLSLLKAIEPQVIGAAVPSFRNFPYKANEILHLYRDFWRLIYRHAPQDRQDLAFRLRNEFRSKRYMAGPRQISNAVRRGQGIYDVQKAMLESKSMRRSGLTGKGLGAQCVDALWDQLQISSNNIIPGLRNFSSSRQITTGQCGTQGTYQRCPPHRRGAPLKAMRRE